MPREVGARCRCWLWARDITNQRVGLYAFYGNPYALVSGRGRIDLRLGRTFTAALSVLECRGAQSKRNTTRHNSSGTNQVEPRCRKALTGDDGVVSAVTYRPIDLSGDTTSSRVDCQN